MKIREVERTCASPKAGQRQWWVEWQVVDGRKVISRHDTKEQAEAALVKLGKVGA